MTQVDYRAKEYTIRRRALVRWCVWSIMFDDCDPALFMTNYLFDRFEHNWEQRLWIAWIYGTTYQFPTTWVIWNEFPDFELVDAERLEWWNRNNYRRLRYQTDTKYNKGFLPQQFESYKDWIGNQSQRSTFNSICINHDPVVNFGRLFKEVKNNLYKFGRYSTWFYMQTLKQCCNLNIDAPDLLLGDYSGSRSHRNGLCLGVGKDEWVNERLSAAQIDWLEEQAVDILAEVRSLLPGALRHKVDMFAFESMLCSFKKLFRGHHSRYLGYYLARQAEEIALAENDGWTGIDWTPLWEARKETLDQTHLKELLEPKIDQSKMHHMVDFGQIDRLNWIFDDEQPVEKQDLENFFQ